MSISLEQKRVALSAIARSNGGILEPDLVVQAAREPDHVLHPLFDWDEGRAAMQHWRAVARSIIREVEVRITVNRQSVTTVAYVKDPRSEGKQQGYIALSSVERRSEHARMVVEAEMARVESAIRRAREIANVLGLERDLEKLLLAAVDIRARAKVA